MAIRTEWQADEQDSPLLGTDREARIQLYRGKIQVAQERLAANPSSAYWLQVKKETQARLKAILRRKGA